MLYINWWYKSFFSIAEMFIQPVKHFWMSIFSASWFMEINYKCSKTEYFLKIIKYNMVINKVNS